MKNTLLLISLLFLLNSCGHKHRSAQEIYDSGVIGDTADWSKPYIVNGVYDMRIYKYDSSLIVLRRYADDNPKIHCGTSFLYHNKMEGTSLTAIPNDFDLWVAHYKNGKEDGLALRYNQDVIKTRIFFKDDTAIYEVTCDYNGHPIDSTCYRNGVYTYYKNGVKTNKATFDSHGAPVYKVDYNKDGAVADSQHAGEHYIISGIEPIDDNITRPFLKAARAGR